MTQTETLIVGATRMAADEFARRRCVELGGAFGLHRFSPGALAVEIASPQLALAGKSLLAGIAVDALAARAVQECRAQSSLQWFEPVANTPGFFRALASTLSELRMNRVDSAALRNAGLAGADLSRLIDAYEHYLSEQRLADSAEIYRTAASVARDDKYLFRGAALVLLDVVPRRKVERDFIDALRSAASEVTEIAGAGRHPKGDKALHRLRSYVFSSDAPPEHELDETLEFHSATDEARECVEIARSILFTSGDGLVFDQSAILLRNPEAYQPLVEDALRRAGIPAFFTHGARRPNPSGRALLALLACAAEGLTASRFSEYLSLGQVPEPDIKGEPPKRDPTWVPVQGELFPETPQPPAEEPVAAAEGPAEVRTPQHWERLLVDAAVIGGRERWVRRLDGLDREFEKQLEELHREDDPRAVHVERQRDRLQSLRKFALPLIDVLDGLPKSAFWQEWLDALERLVATALRRPDPVLSVLAELRPMANTGPVTLEEVREVLTHRLSFLRMEPTERRYGKVFVATIPEAAGMTFHTVYLPGLGEDLFPKKAFEDPLLLDVDREKVSADLLVQHTRVAEERLLLQTAAATAESKLWISYPRMNVGQGRSRGPSFYAIEVIRAATGRVPDLQQLQRSAAEASQSQPGWPSPRSAEIAIDDAEYDLAIIRKLLRLTPSERRGAARYLLTANEQLQRSLQTRWRRWSAKWSDADGIVDPDQPTLDALHKHSPRQRAFSATALQHFAVCPYRFLLSAIHRLETRPEAVALERLDPLTKGRLLHDIQFRVLTDLQSKELLPITVENQSHVKEIAGRIFDETATEYRDLLAPAILRVWEGEIENLRWDIQGWISRMAEANDGWVPKWFELRFGSRANPVVLSDGTRVRGAIDLIEERDGLLRITDYKSGKAQPPFGFTRNGEVLQPLLYAQAAELVLGKPAASARLFFSTQRAGYKIDEIAVTDEGRAYFWKVMDSIDESLKQGFVPAAPRADGCKYCDYKIVCGPYEETRIKRKHNERLRLLEQLRDIP